MHKKVQISGAYLLWEIVEPKVRKQQRNPAQTELAAPHREPQACCLHPPPHTHTFYFFSLFPFFVIFLFSRKKFDVQAPPGTNIRWDEPVFLNTRFRARLARLQLPAFFFFTHFFLSICLVFQVGSWEKTKTRSAPLKRCPWLVWIIVANKTGNQALLFTPLSHALASSLVFVIPQKLFITHVKTPPKSRWKILFLSGLFPGFKAGTRQPIGGRFRRRCARFWLVSPESKRLMASSLLHVH